jgi:cysteine sulfinate desulfinase/cysteine desulfurase-like protein
MNIIWPWAAREAVEAYKAEADHLWAMNARLEADLREANVRITVAKSDVSRLTAALSQAHFRDPKTGRIGKRGKRS